MKNNSLRKERVAESLLWKRKSNKKKREKRH